MSERDLITRVGESLRANEGFIQKRIDGALPRVAAHEHGRFCFPFCACRRLEKQVKQDQGEIDAYESVIAELIDNNSQPAINMLRQKASQVRVKWYEELEASLSGFANPMLLVRASSEFMNRRNLENGMLRLAYELETKTPRVKS